MRSVRPLLLTLILGGCTLFAQPATQPPIALPIGEIEKETITPQPPIVAEPEEEIVIPPSAPSDFPEKVKHRTTERWIAGWKLFRDEAPTAARGGVVLVGDSLTRDFPAELLKTPLPVHKRGIGGDKVGGWKYYGILDRLDVSVCALQPSAVVVMIGVNDIGWAGTPHENMAANYDRFLAGIRDCSPQTRIIACSILPTRAEEASVNPPIVAMNEIFRTIAKNHGAEFVDLHSKFTDEKGELREEYSVDSAHLSEEGYRVWSSVLNEMLATTPPAELEEEWQTAEPADVGLQPQLIDEMMARIREGSYKNIHSVLIVKDGKLVVEEYFPGIEEDGKLRAYDRETLHGIHSATKSVNALLIGIAIDRKEISGVEAKISELMPDYADALADQKDNIRLHHLLAMTAGWAWNESVPYSDPRNDHVGMNNSPDPLRYLFERPMAAIPGATFNYNSGISIALGEIIHAKTGLRADDYAREHLFKPLGITAYHWLKYPNGVVQTGGGLYMRPRDMAKIGLMALNGGRWNGSQVVSEQWIAKSMQQHAPDQEYGYQWWLGRLPAGDHALVTYGGLGRGGQFILIFPELKMVAVFTGWNDENGLREQPYDMMRRFIGPALSAGRSQPASAE